LGSFFSKAAALEATRRETIRRLPESLVTHPRVDPLNLSGHDSRVFHGLLHRRVLLELVRFTTRLTRCCSRPLRDSPLDPTNDLGNLVGAQHPADGGGRNKGLSLFIEFVLLTELRSAVRALDRGPEPGGDEWSQFEFLTLSIRTWLTISSTTLTSGYVASITMPLLQSIKFAPGKSLVPNLPC
jgi:hypothetical protein